MSAKYISNNWRLLNQENSSKNDNYGLTFDGAANEDIRLGNTTYLLPGQPTAATTNNPKFSASIFFNFESSVVGSLVWMIGAGQGGGAAYWALRKTTGDKLDAIFRTTSGGYTTITGGTTLTSDTWYHACVTWDGYNINLYLNGVSDATQVAATTFYWLNSGAYPPYPTIGSYRYGTAVNTNRFIGKISQASIYDYALTSTQIETLYGSSSLGSGNPMALKPQPVAYYPLGDNSASNPLTQPNVAVEDATAFDFGTSDVIEGGTSFGDSLGDNYSGDVSFSFWYNADTNGGIFSLGSGSSYGELHAQIVSGKLSWGIDNDVWRRITSTSLGLNTWNHIVLIYKNGSELDTKIYVNGSEASTTTAGGAFPTSNLDFAGKSLNIGSFWVFNYDGKLSNFQAFNTELTSANVETLYNSGVPLYTGTQPQAANLKSWYKLNNTANWEADSSGNWQIPEATSAYPQSFDFAPNDTITTTKSIFKYCNRFKCYRNLYYFILVKSCRGFSTIIYGTCKFSNSYSRI